MQPSADLVAISIEGASPDELSKNAPALPGEDLIDIAEYFGSEDIGQATCVCYLQLKHSTVNPTVPWTASGLEKTLSGFAKRHQELSMALGAQQAARLHYCFVTNRPISSDIVETVEDAAAQTPPRHPKELAKLENFTGLNGSTLAAFCRQLRFDAGQDPYWDQRNLLYQDLGGYLPDADVDGPLFLKELVTRKALSESEKTPVITKADVLRALRTDETRLFPANCLNATACSVVPRTQHADIIQGILNATGRPVLVHALAGVGKSVLATQISQLLPPGSRAVLYDCFGNGQYRSATGYRHRHQDALVQIANEFAATGLCHPLIPTPHADRSLYMRAFVHRLRQAATILSHTQPNALLCIIVDAADNAELIARELGESRSFARDLLRETLPNAVRLVMLCRTHRQQLLDPPPTAHRFELQPFSRNETAAHLRNRYPEATDRDVDEFHRLTSHNPRVQALALSRNLPLPDTLRLLGPNPSNVDTTIGALLHNAISKLSDDLGPIEQESAERICLGLSTLRPPIPVPILAATSQVPESAIRTFVLDLGRPLHLAGDTIQFYDEPAETWFRERFRPGPEAMRDLVGRLLPLAATSAYAASTLPQQMLDAGQFDELVELALSSTGLPESNQLVRHDVELQRLHFALRASLRKKRLEEAAKLALKAGNESAGDARRRSTIQENTDLAGRFLEPGIIQDLVSRRTFAETWRGSHHLYEAALLSTRPEFIGDARSRLRMAEDWLRAWATLPESDRAQERVSEEDIAELALAHLHIHDTAAAATSLRWWRPREVSFRAGRLVARRLVEGSQFAALDELAISASNNLFLLLAIILELRRVQRAPTPQVIRRALRMASRPLLILKPSGMWDTEEAFLQAVTALVEAALLSSLCDRDSAAKLLDRYLPVGVPRGVASPYSLSRCPLLRAYALRAVLRGQAFQVAQLAGSEVQFVDGRKRRDFTDEAREFASAVAPLLPWYHLWATTLLGDVPRGKVGAEAMRAQQATAPILQRLYHHRSQYSNDIVLIWMEALCNAGPNDASLTEALRQWIAKLEQPLFTSTLTSLARLCGVNLATRPLALQYAAEAFARIRDTREDAASKANAHVAVARAILVSSDSDAEAYFNEALSVSARIGDENLPRWGALLDLAERAASPHRPVPEVAYQVARCAELTRAHVERDKHFDWHGTLRALTALSASSALAIVSRWRDRGFGRSRSLLRGVVENLLKTNTVDALDALPLIAFDTDWDLGQMAEGALAACATQADKQSAGTFLYRHIPWTTMSARTWKSVRTAAHKHQVVLPELDRHIEFSELEEAAANARRVAQEKAHLHQEPIETEPDWGQVFAGLDLTSVSGISAAYAAFSRARRPFESFRFVSRALSQVPVGSEPKFIDAFGEAIDVDLFDLRDLVESMPEPWKARPAVTTSLRRTLVKVCRRLCTKYAWTRDYEILPWGLACSLSGISEEDLVDEILDAIADSPAFAQSGRVFSLVGLLTRRLSQDQALEALRFGLDHLSASLRESDGDGQWTATLAPPSSVGASIAGYVWAALAAPSGRVRWQACHAVFGFCAMGRGGILGELVSFARSGSGGPFVDACLHFYKLHGLQWLLIAFARAAQDYPETLIPFSADVIAWASTGHHVMIRQFAAETARAWLSRGLLADRQGLRELMAGVNKTGLPVVESKSFSRQTERPLERHPLKERFFFGMDIGPYWYASLGRVFAISQAEVEDAADDVIRGELGYPGRGAWNEDERARRETFEREEASHSHGSYPRFDNLQFYLSYHAMMSVAGKLLATRPVHRDPQCAHQDDFAEWLAERGLSRCDGRWLSDRRDPTPTDGPAWREQEQPAGSEGAVSAAEFDEALRGGDVLHIWGHWTNTNARWTRSVRINSALVSPERSVALLHALGTANDPHDYCLPWAESEHEIDDSGFVLRGWITDQSAQRGLDVLDPWSGGVSYPPPMPARFVVETLNLTGDADNRVWYDTAGQPVMSSSVWGEVEERDDGKRPESGQRLQASPKFLEDLLGKLSYDMIVKVEVERHQHERNYGGGPDDERERVPDTARIYLLRSNGDIVTE